MFGALVLAAVMLASPLSTAARAPGAAAAPSQAPAPPASRTFLLGHSAQGRPIRVTRLGSGPRSVLAVGCVHGDECSGLAVLRRLRELGPPPGVTLWLLDLANPDGTALNTRQNARGVDLNRNFPYRWQPLPQGTYYSGPNALSEPESQALYGFLRRVRPALSIWYHQHANLVDDSGGDPAIGRRYAAIAQMVFKRFDRPPGSITSWLNTTYPTQSAFVVELPAGQLPADAVRRHAAAVEALAVGAP